MMNKVQAATLPVAAHPQVAVFGGGPAGIAAAIGAARTGADTLIVERNGCFGGMSTVAGAICGLYTSSKTQPCVQLVQGFAGEFYEELKKRGGVAQPYPFGDTIIIVHDPVVWRTTADDMVSESGTNVLFHTIATDVVMDQDRLIGVVIENKSGRQVIYADRFVDATGDGDICARAAIPYTFGKNGQVQYATTTFRMAGVDVAIAKSHSAKQLEEWILKAETAGYRLPRKHIYVLPSPRDGEILCNMTAVVNPDGSPIDATDAWQLSGGELAGRKQAREYVRFLRNFVPGFETSTVVELSEELGIRQSRTIRGVTTLKNQDIYDAVKSEHSVARSAWPIEAHGANGIFMFYLNDDYYDIPYETMLPEKFDNLLACGRLISAEHEALASARVSAQCLLTGYAAGCASALSFKEGCGNQELRFEKLAKRIQY